MELRVEISHDGRSKVFAIDACEDLLHDYKYFLKQAKRFDDHKSKTIFLHKRYLRGALLTLFAYAESVINRWIYKCLERKKEEAKFEKFERKSLEKKLNFLRSSVKSGAKVPDVASAKDLRDLIVHFKPGRDAEFFDGISLSTLMRAGQELTRWLSKMERALRIERHPKSSKLVRKLARSLGSVIVDVSSKP